jgi:hypothetical protein
MILKATSRIARWGRLLFLPCFGCSRSLLPDNKILLPFLISTTLLLGSNSGLAATLNLSSDTEIANAGYYQLSWDGTDGPYHLEESSTTDFSTYRTLYQGDDLATVISGKPDGVYYYRISLSNEQQIADSNVVKVTVAHHPLKTALLFFLAGAIVFVATFIMIIKGNRQQA